MQADILKEDQAQNTCIFSTEFSLRCMGDVQQFYINNNIRNHYSVSISGYHIAEAGANPITQLAFTLANGFTYVEAYHARGMAVQDRLAVQVGLGAGSEGTAGGAGALWVETRRGRRVRDGGGEHPWAQLVVLFG